MRTHKVYTDGKLTEETPYTLNEELQEDAKGYFKQIALDSIGGLPWPKDYDEFKTRYKPADALDTLLTRKGINPADVPAQTRAMMAVFLDYAIQSAVYVHGKFPGQEV